MPQRRELVFDIDMTDYDEIRTCCTDKKICKRCWGYIAAAVKVLDHSLRGEWAVALVCIADGGGRDVWISALAVGLLWSSRYPSVDLGSSGPRLDG